MWLPRPHVEKAGGGTPGCREEAAAESCSQDRLYPNFLPGFLPSRSALPRVFKLEPVPVVRLAVFAFSGRFLKGHVGESALAFNDQLYFPQKSLDLAGLFPTV